MARPLWNGVGGVGNRTEDNMRRPVEPQKPYKVNKPVLPEKEIMGHETIKTIEVSNYDSFTMEDFLGNFVLQGDSKTFDIKKFSVQIECEVERGYYDDVTAKAKLSICENKMVKNPSYEYMSKNYAVSLKRYEKDKIKYDADMIAYKIKMEEYTKSLPAWKEQDRKHQIKFHEKELKRLKEEK